MRKYLRFLVLCSLFVQSPAQAQVPVERIYLQTDREQYVEGETIYFIGHVLSDGDTLRSTNLFAEIWDSTFNKLAEICLPVIDGTASGSLTIPKERGTGSLFLRAYTKITALQNFQFVKSLTTGYTKVAATEGSQPVFFPEGGKIVYNADNVVAFKATPAFQGTIRNNKGDVLVAIQPAYEGMGSFIIHPVPGDIYSCHWQENGREMSKALPLPVEKGIALHVRQSPDTIYFEIDNGGNKDPNILKPRIHLLIEQEIAYLVELNMLTKNKFSYFIPLNEFKPGLAELKVLGANDDVLASRPVFITKKSFDTNIELDVVKKDLAKRGENILRIDFHDTLLRYLSVSITDAAYSERTGGPGSLSAFLPPATAPVIKDKQDYASVLDLHLLTMGSTSMNEKGSKASAVTSAPEFLRLSGVVKRGKKPVAEKEILVGIRSAYTGKELYKVATDDQGRFALEGVVIYGEAFVHCRLPGKSDEELTCEIQLSSPEPADDADLFNAFKQIAASMIRSYEKPRTVADERDNITGGDSLVFENAITLEEVVVKTDNNQVIRKRLEDLERKYIDQTPFAGYFATGETLDVMNDPMTAKYLDVFSYIGMNMRSVSMRLERGVKQLFYFGRGQGGQTMVTVFYLGNSKVDRDMLEGITLDQVAVIKFIPMLGSEPGFPPALAIFLKKPGDQGYWEKDRYQLAEQTVKGYAIAKEFQLPDYKNEQAKVLRDTRKTLLWQPYTPVDKGIAEIKFFNNDVTKRIRIVVEGIGADGTLVFFERVLE